LHTDCSSTIEQDAPIRISKQQHQIKNKIKATRQFRIKMNNTELRTTQKLKEEKAHLALEEPWL